MKDLIENIKYRLDGAYALLDQNNKQTQPLSAEHKRKLYKRIAELESEYESITGKKYE